MANGTVCVPTVEDHCCHTPVGVCQFLDRIEMRCTLRTDLGSWEAVHSSSSYRASPIGLYFAMNYPGFGCGDFPQNLDVPVGGRCCWEGD